LSNLHFHAATRERGCWRRHGAGVHGNSSRPTSISRALHRPIHHSAHENREAGHNCDRRRRDKDPEPRDLKPDPRRPAPRTGVAFGRPSGTGLGPVTGIGMARAFGTARTRYGLPTHRASAAHMRYSSSRLNAVLSAGDATSVCTTRARYWASRRLMPSVVGVGQRGHVIFPTRKPTSCWDGN
jgi:hypothetical protein